MTAFEYRKGKKLSGACMSGLTYVMLAQGWEKETLGERPCQEGVTIQVSTGTGGRVILAGKLQREKRPYGGRLQSNILLNPNKFLINNV